MVKCRSQPDINVGLSNVPETKIPRVIPANRAENRRAPAENLAREFVLACGHTIRPHLPLSFSYSRSFKFKRAKAIVTRQCRTSWHNRRNNKILDVVVIVRTAFFRNVFRGSARETLEKRRTKGKRICILFSLFFVCLFVFTKKKRERIKRSSSTRTI